MEIFLGGIFLGGNFFEVIFSVACFIFLFFRVRVLFVPDLGHDVFHIMDGYVPKPITISIKMFFLHTHYTHLIFSILLYSFFFYISPSKKSGWSFSEPRYSSDVAGVDAGTDGSEVGADVGYTGLFVLFFYGFRKHTKKVLADLFFKRKKILFGFIYYFFF